MTREADMYRPGGLRARGVALRLAGLVKAVLAALVLFAAPVRAEAEGVGIGLDGLKDWNVAVPLLDLMKLSRPWIGHGPDEWEAMSYEDLVAAGVLDAQGWPTRIPEGLTSVGTLMLTMIPEDAGGVAGRYQVRYEGSGEIRLGARAANVTGGDGLLEFDYVPGRGSVQLDIVSTDPEGTGDYIRNITVVRTDRVAAFESGAVFNPDWLAALDGFEVLRFMDWGETNFSPQSRWADRPELDDVRYTIEGAPVELMIALANETGIDPWFNVPHLADDDFMRRYAETVRDGLDPGLRAYVEYSNEVWNHQFSQAVWAEEQAMARWGVERSGVQFYALRATRMAEIWGEVFGAGAEDRLVRVIATQTSWLGREKDILGAPLWLAEEPGRTPPAAHFDAYAVAGYFGAFLGGEKWNARVKGWIADSTAAAVASAEAQGLADEALATFVGAHRFDAAVAPAAAVLANSGAGEKTDMASLVGTVLPYHAKAARAAGLELVAYEGGTHVAAVGPLKEDEEVVAFFAHLNYTPEMADLYRTLLDGWARLDAGVFVAFRDVAPPNKWGSWGHLRHLTDSNPRWDVLVTARDGEG